MPSICYFFQILAIPGGIRKIFSVSSQICAIHLKTETVANIYMFPKGSNNSRPCILLELNT